MPKIFRTIFLEKCLRIGNSRLAQLSGNLRRNYPVIILIMPRESIDPRRLLLQVVKILNELEIPYIVTGGIAILIWGRPRFTADIDIVVELDWGKIDNLEKALMALGEFGYVDKEAMRDALKNKGEFNFIDGNTGVKVDFWVAGNNELDKSKMARRRTRKILGKTVYFISPEDLILSKLHWYTMGESTRQLEDIESVLKISGEKLDMKYIKKWAKKMGVLDILNNVINSKEE